MRPADASLQGILLAIWFTARLELGAVPHTYATSHDSVVAPWARAALDRELGAVFYAHAILDRVVRTPLAATSLARDLGPVGPAEASALDVLVATSDAAALGVLLVLGHLHFPLLRGQGAPR